jgi:MtN3 and saliva related transmembrane protein
MHRFRDGMISRTSVKDTIHRQASHRLIAASGATTLAVLLTALVALGGCAETSRDVQSLLIPSFQRSEIIGIVAGFGTTFAAVPDLVAMLRHRSTAGMHPRMAAIMGIFQIVWVYYGVLIASRPVVLWNLIAVLINLSSVGAHGYFLRQERSRKPFLNDCRR